MPSQPDLFGKRKAKRKKRGTPAPETLSVPEIRRLEDWAEGNVPWLRREALESFENLGTYVEECLLYWRGRGDLRARWPQTIMARILRVERKRVTKLAQEGSDSARQALKDPQAWARAYDRRSRASRAAGAAWTPEGTIRPKGGGEVIQLGDRRKGRD